MPLTPTDPPSLRREDLTAAELLSGEPLRTLAQRRVSAALEAYTCHLAQTAVAGAAAGLDIRPVCLLLAEGVHDPASDTPSTIDELARLARGPLLAAWLRTGLPEEKLFVGMLNADLDWQRASKGGPLSLPQEADAQLLGQVLTVLLHYAQGCVADGYLEPEQIGSGVDRDSFDRLCEAAERALDAATCPDTLWPLSEFCQATGVAAMAVATAAAQVVAWAQICTPRPRARGRRLRLVI